MREIVPPYIRLMRNFAVDPVTGCWNWQASKTITGYGNCNLVMDGRHVKSHTASYLFHVGPIPPRYELDHLCRNRACGNPAHLEAVTKKVNRQRTIGMPRLIEPHCNKDHKLTKGACLACARARWNAGYYKREVLNRPPAVLQPNQPKRRAKIKAPPLLQQDLSRSRRTSR